MHLQGVKLGLPQVHRTRFDTLMPESTKPPAWTITNRRGFLRVEPMGIEPTTSSMPLSPLGEQCYRLPEPVPSEQDDHDRDPRSRINLAR